MTPAGTSEDTPARQRYWHATPLHYLPQLLQSGALFSAASLRERGLPVRARHTAAVRDRRLKLDGYVHLAMEPRTPLLADKLRRGCPHALLEFDSAVTELPGAALLRYNSSAWRHREDFYPVTDRNDWPALLAERSAGRLPSAAVLIPNELPLAGLCRAILTVSEAERQWLADLAERLFLILPAALRADSGLFPPAVAPDLSLYQAYSAACVAAGQVLAPPDLPFE